MSEHLFAAVHGDGVPSVNVWHCTREALEVTISDRRANGEAWPDERVEEFCCLHAYNARLAEHNLPRITLNGWFRP